MRQLLPPSFTKALAGGLWPELTVFRSDFALHSDALQHMRFPKLSELRLDSPSAQAAHFAGVLECSPLLETAELIAKSSMFPAPPAAPHLPPRSSRVVMHRLTSLLLHAADDDTLSRLGFPQLRTLHLASSAVRIAAFDALNSHLPALQQLTVSGAAILRFDSPPLHRCETQTELSLLHSTATAEVVSAALASFPALRRLTLGKANIGARALLAVASRAMQQLEVFDCRAPGIAPGSIDAAALHWLTESCRVCVWCCSLIRRSPRRCSSK